MEDTTKTDATDNAPRAKAKRVLGDEWEDWTGELDESATYDESARLFAVFAGLTILVLTGVTGIAVYMIEPRLFLWHPVVMYAIRAAATLLVALIIVWCGLIIASVFTGKNLFFHGRLGQVTATRLLPFAIAVAKRLGISRDRLGNSFVTFSNAIVRASHKPGRGSVIILLPRCLNSDMKRQIKDLAERAGVGAFTATGGGQARNIIRQHRPSAVIGIACERDLMSGIHDVAPKMPTVGITNKRPEGPCKNTVVDLDEVRAAIEMLMGVKLD